MPYILTLLMPLFFFMGCAQKQPLLSQSATILIKTPQMKFYDKGFITQYDDHTNIEIYTAGTQVLYLDLYEGRICKSTFECTASSQFNEQFLHTSYENDFLKKLFDKKEKNTVFRDKERRILIKIRRD